MRGLLAAVLAVGASSAAAQPAPPSGPPTTVEGVVVTAPRPAPPQPAGPRLELYEERNLGGGGVILVRETPNLLFRGFSDRARSARAVGAWQLCADPQFGGRCAVVTGDTVFLGSVDLSERVSSARPLPPS